jgi:hypothetical protein
VASSLHHTAGGGQPVEVDDDGDSKPSGVSASAEVRRFPRRLVSDAEITTGFEDISLAERSAAEEGTDV